MRGRDGPGGAAGCDGAWGLGCGGVGGHGSDGASGDSVHSPPSPPSPTLEREILGRGVDCGFSALYPRAPRPPGGGTLHLWPGGSSVHAAPDRGSGPSDPFPGSRLLCPASVRPFAVSCTDPASRPGAPAFRGPETLPAALPPAGVTGRYSVSEAHFFSPVLLHSGLVWTADGPAQAAPGQRKKEQRVSPGT